MISVTPHRRRRDDRAGDPLDGLVNLFDLGIVLSVAFLLAALSSLHLAGTIIHRGLRPGTPSAIVIAPGSRVAPLPAPGAQTIGPGVQVGVVYRLADGRLVYVQGPPGTTGAAGATSKTPTVTGPGVTTTPGVTGTTTTPTTPGRGGTTTTPRAGRTVPSTSSGTGGAGLTPGR